MSRQHIHKRYPVATMCLVVGLAMLALAMQPSGVAAVTLDEAVDGQQVLCRLLGSNPEPPVTRTTADGDSFVRMTCHGGMLDGVTCDIVPGADAGDTVTSSCYFARPPDNIHVAPVAGVEGVLDADPDGSSGETGDITVDPVVAEDPTRGDPVVIEPQPGLSVDDTVDALIEGCQILGGEDVEIDRSGPDAPPGSIDVRCVGGPIYDLHCTVAVESLTCLWLEPAVEATVDVVVTDVNVAGRGPTPAVAELVDTPTVPMDDDNGMDPTTPPTFTAPGNVGDNRAPTGGVAEDPAVGGGSTGGGDEMPPTPAPTVPGPGAVDDNAVPPGGVAEDPARGD